MQLSNLARIPRTLRNIARGREIAAVIARHGFDDLLDRTGLTSGLERVRRVLTRPVGEPGAIRPTTEARIRRTSQTSAPMP